MATNKTLAKTILSQLGGDRFIMFTGSKNFIALENGLRFSVARNKTGANRCEIIYDEGMDLYNVRFYRQSTTKTFDIKITDYAKYEGIYCDQLEEIFTHFTGLVTHF